MDRDKNTHISNNDTSTLGHFDHGGVPYSAQHVLDFSASLNPLGMPDAVKQTLRDHIEDFAVYPDMCNKNLADAVAAFEHIDVLRTCMCAGATDAFDRVVSVFKPEYVLLFDPCFSGYERALRHSSASLVRTQTASDRNFAITLDDVSDAFSTYDHTIRVSGRTLAPTERVDVAAIQENPDDTLSNDLLFLCTPNNPTGAVIDAEVLNAVLSKAQARDIIVVLDECFADLAGLPSAASLQESFANLVIVKAFTKTFALAGLRAGYIITPDAQLAKRLHRAGQQWAVSMPAQFAGIAALSCADYLEESISYIAAERDYVVDALSSLGLRVIPSQANFLLFQCAHVLNLYQLLLDRGIAIRRCENFYGLDSSWFRVAIRSHVENTHLLEVLEEVVQQ